MNESFNGALRTLHYKYTHYRKIRPRDVNFQGRFCFGASFWVRRVGSATRRDSSLPPSPPKFEIPRAALNLHDSSCSFILFRFLSRLSTSRD